MTTDELIDRIISEEGHEFTDNPKDKGGPTKFGITQAALSDWLGRDAGWSEVRALDEATARKIYHQRYIVKPGFEYVIEISEPIGVELADMGVNMGPERAIEFFIRALNVFNQEGKLYPDLPRRWTVTPASLSALQAFLKYRGKDGESVLLKTLECLRGAQYVHLAEINSEDEAFIYGWMKNRVTL